MQAITCFQAKDLKNFILRRLGAPVIKIEVTEQQIYDCIGRALELYGEYHYDGVNKNYYAIKLTKEQADSGMIDMGQDSNIFAVTQILRTNQSMALGMGGGTVYTWFSDFITSMANGPGGVCTCYSPFSMGTSAGNLGFFSSLMSYKQLMLDMLDPIPDYWYNGTNKQLKVFKNDLVENDIVIIEAYVFSFLQVDKAFTDSPTTSQASDIYNNPTNLINGDINKMFAIDQSAYNVRWVKNYAKQLTKEIWGQILGKFPITLPGGITTNGDRLINEANTEIEKLEQELYNMVVPPPIMMG